MYSPVFIRCLSIIVTVKEFQVLVPLTSFRDISRSFFFNFITAQLLFTMFPYSLPGSRIELTLAMSPNSKNYIFNLLGYQETTDDEWKAERSKRCGNNNKDEDNSQYVDNVNNLETIFDRFEHSR